MTKQAYLLDGSSFDNFERLKTHVVFCSETPMQGRNVRRNREQKTVFLDAQNYRKMNHPKDKFDAVRRNPYSILYSLA